MNVKKIASFILVLLWMAVIFYFSSQQGEGSGNTSRKVCEIIVDIIDIQDKYTEAEKERLIEVIEPAIRKIAHYTIYAIGGIVIANCVYQYSNKEKTLIGISTMVGILYAISDEIHQLMVSGRSGNVRDVLIDSLGVITGIIFFLLLKEITTRVVSKKNASRG